MEIYQRFLFFNICQGNRFFAFGIIYTFLWNARETF